MIARAWGRRCAPRAIAARKVAVTCSVAHRPAARAAIVGLAALLLAGCTFAQAVPTDAPTASQTAGLPASQTPTALPPTWTPSAAPTLPPGGSPTATIPPRPTVRLPASPTPLRPTGSPTYAPVIVPTTATPTITWTAGYPTYIYASPGPVIVNELGVNLLANGGFEGGWRHQGAGEVQVPDGWTAWWYEGPATHDRDNAVGYARPEMKVIRAEPPFLDPPRIFEGEQAAFFFGSFKVVDAGYWQRVPVTPGARLRLSGWGHAWSSHTDSDPRQSQLETGDDRINASMQLGIDPTGGVLALDNAVIWGAPTYNYDRYAPIQPVEATALADFVTVFVRGRTLWPFKHNDFYFDAIALEYIPAFP